MRPQIEKGSPALKSAGRTYHSLGGPLTQSLPSLNLAEHQRATARRLEEAAAKRAAFYEQVLTTRGEGDAFVMLPVSPEDKARRTSHRIASTWQRGGTQRGTPRVRVRRHSCGALC